MDAGVHVTLATGRMFQSALPFARELEMHDPLICYQRALIQSPDDDKPLVHRTVPLASAREIILFARERGLHLNVYLDDQWFAERSDEEARIYQHISGVPPVIVPDLLAITRRRPTKLVLITTEQVATALVAELKAKYGDALYVTKSYPLFVEVTNPAVSKGRALRWLARRLGVPRARVMALGDNMNDADMVEWAGLGVAVGNATPEVLAVADVVCPPVTEEGAAQAIEQFVLEGRPAGVRR
jgi:Cof subfamily protein (haloacid dehalogenase superfamily)